jgi:hypothetical protein
MFFNLKLDEKSLRIVLQTARIRNELVAWYALACTVRQWELLTLNTSCKCLKEERNDSNGKFGS